jgi:DNA-binding MarR family transcriptional regulator
MSTGHVYFLVNSSMPGLLKVGFTTTTLQQRLAELEATGVPEPFIVGAAFLVSDAQGCERRLHELFHEKRRARNREFFELSLADALKQAFPVIEGMIAAGQTGSTDSSTDQKKLDFAETEILTMLVHEPRGEPIEAEAVAREHDIHIQKVLLACARLLDMGLIEQQHNRRYGTDRYALTHKGRKYCFDHEIVIKEIIEEPHPYRR